MTSHSYSVGEHVIYSEQGLSGGIWSGEYEVNGLLAGGGENPLYQLTCADQSHHRIVSEHEITAMPALDMTNYRLHSGSRNRIRVGDKGRCSPIQPYSSFEGPHHPFLWRVCATVGS